MSNPDNPAMNENNTDSGRRERDRDTVQNSTGTARKSVEQGTTAAKAASTKSTSSTTSAKAGRGKTGTVTTASDPILMSMRHDMQRLTEQVAAQQQQQAQMQNMMLQMLSAQLESQAEDEPVDNQSTTSASSTNVDSIMANASNTHPVSDSDQDEEAGLHDQQQKVEKTTKNKTKEKDAGFAKRYCVNEDMGDPIPESTAQALKSLIITDMDLERKEEALKSQKTPSNCETLLVTKVNPAIWDNLSPNTRSRDVKIQRAIKPLVKGVIAMAKTENLTRDQEEGLALVANGLFELHMLRRELIKPELNKKFVHLCKAEVKPTNWLFGDDLAKQVKELDEQHKAAGGLVSRGQKKFTKNRYSSAPYPSGGQGWKGKKNRAPATFPNPYTAKNLYQQLLSATQLTQQRQNLNRPQNRFKNQSDSAAAKKQDK